MKTTVIANDVSYQCVTSRKTAWFTIFIIFLFLTSCSSPSSSTSDYQRGSSGTTTEFTEPTSEPLVQQAQPTSESLVQQTQPTSEPLVQQAQPRSGSGYNVGDSVLIGGIKYTITRVHCPGVGNPSGCNDWRYDLVNPDNPTNDYKNDVQL